MNDLSAQDDEVARMFLEGESKANNLNSTFYRIAIPMPTAHQEPREPMEQLEPVRTH